MTIQIMQPTATIQMAMTTTFYFASLIVLMIFLMSHRNSAWCIAWPIIVAFSLIGPAPRVRPQVTDLYRLRDSTWRDRQVSNEIDDGLNPDVAAIDSETLDSLEIGYRAGYPGLVI